MKNLLIIIALLSSSIQLSAQHETLFKGVRHWGIFGGPIVEFSSIKGNISTSVGGGGGLIIDNLFIGGYGLASASIDDVLSSNDLDQLQIAHGGLWLGYTNRPFKLMHVFASAKIGWGAVDFDLDQDLDFDDGVFVITPEIGLELNVFKFFRVGFTGGYRFVDGVRSNPDLDKDEFNSFTGTLTLRFGLFGRYKSHRHGY